MQNPNLDTKMLTEQVIDTRRKLTNSIKHYEFLNKGGMALADHKGETIRAYVDCIHVLRELHYFEELAGMPLTRLSTIPECKYMEKSYAKP